MGARLCEAELIILISATLILMLSSWVQTLSLWHGWEKTTHSRPPETASPLHLLLIILLLHPKQQHREKKLEYRNRASTSLLNNSRTGQKKKKKKVFGDRNFWQEFLPCREPLCRPRYEAGMILWRVWEGTVLGNGGITTASEPVLAALWSIQRIPSSEDSNVNPSSLPSSSAYSVELRSPVFLAVRTHSVRLRRISSEALNVI